MDLARLPSAGPLRMSSRWTDADVVDMYRAAVAEVRYLREQFAASRSFSSLDRLLVLVLVMSGC